MIRSYISFKQLMVIETWSGEELRDEDLRYISFKQLMVIETADRMRHVSAGFCYISFKQLMVIETRVSLRLNGRLRPLHQLQTADGH